MPGGPAPQPGRWDSGAPRPGPRTARRQDTRGGRDGRGGLGTIGIVIAIVVVLGAAVGAYLVFRGKPGTPQAQPPKTTTQPTRTAQPAKSAGTGKPGKSATSTARYTLAAPATAGGYAKLTSVPAKVQTAAGTVSQAIKTAAVKDAGGKVTGSFATAYQLSGGQVLSFTGFTGTFDPAKVMDSLAGLGTNSHSQTAGPHGGMLTCSTASGTPDGTVCVWATTTTIGVTEFFASSDLPEVVTVQSKAAADTVKLRDGVETAKS